MPLHDVSASPPSGQVYERTESISASGLTGTTGARDTIWTSANYAFDGNTRVKLEFLGTCFNNGHAYEVIAEAYLDGSSLTIRILDFIFPTASNDIRPFYVAYWHTPSAGVHNYGIKSYSSTGSTYDLSRNGVGTCAIKMSRDDG